MVASPGTPSGKADGKGRSRRKRAEAAAAVPADEPDTALLRQLVDVAECVATESEKLAIDEVIRQLAGSQQVVFEGADREAVRKELVSHLAHVSDGVLTPLLDRLLGDADEADAAQAVPEGTELLERVLAATATRPLVPGIGSLKAPPNDEGWPEWARHHRRMRQFAATILKLRSELAKEARRAAEEPSGLSLERLGLAGEAVDTAQERLTAFAVSALVTATSGERGAALLLALNGLLEQHGSQRRSQRKEAGQVPGRPAFGGPDSLRNATAAVLTEHVGPWTDQSGAGAAVWAPWVAAYLGDLRLVGMLAGGLLDSAARSGRAALTMRHVAGALRADFPTPPAAAAAALARRRRGGRAEGGADGAGPAAEAPLLHLAAEPAGQVIGMRSPYAGRRSPAAAVAVADPFLWWRLPGLFGLQELTDTLVSPAMVAACELAAARRLRNSSSSALLVAAQSERLALEGMLWRVALGCRPRSGSFRAKRAAQVQAEGEVKSLLSLLRRELPTGKQAVLRQAVMRARAGCRDGRDIPDEAAVARLSREVLALLGPSAPAFFSLVDRCADAITLRDIDHHMPSAKRARPSASSATAGTSGGSYGGRIDEVFEAGGFGGEGSDASGSPWSLPAVGAAEVEATSQRLTDQVTPTKLADILTKVLTQRALNSVRYRLRMLARAVQPETRGRLRLQAVDVILSSLGGLALPLQGAVEGCVDVLSPEMLDAAAQEGAAAGRTTPAKQTRATGVPTDTHESAVATPAGIAESGRRVGAAAAAGSLAGATAEGESLLGPGLPSWVLAMYTAQAAQAVKADGGVHEQDGAEQVEEGSFLGPWGRVRAVEAAGGDEGVQDQERAETLVVAETRKLVLPLRFRVHRVHTDAEAQRLGEASLQLAQSRVLDALLASGVVADGEDAGAGTERTASSRALMWDTLAPLIQGAAAEAGGTAEEDGLDDHAAAAVAEQQEEEKRGDELDAGDDPLGLGWGDPSLVDPEPEHAQLAVSSGVSVAPVARRTVMLCNLPLNAREEDVRRTMERCGPIASVRMESGRSDRLLAILRKEAAAADRKAGDKRKGRRAAGRPRGPGAERRMAKMEASRLDKLQVKYPKHAFVTFEDEAAMKAALSPEVGVFGMVVGSRACSVASQQACKYVHLSNAPKRHKPVAVLALLAQALAPLGLELRAADSAVMAADLQSSGDVLLEADDHLAARDIVGLLGGHSLVPGETMVVGWSTEKEYNGAKPRLPPSLTKPRQSAAGRGESAQLGNLVTIDTAYSSADLERAVGRSPVGWAVEPSSSDQDALWGAVGAGFAVPRRSVGLGDR